jgi:hypothetical protein
MASSASHSNDYDHDYLLRLHGSFFTSLLLKAGMDRHVGALGRLIIWRPFRPIFFQCLIQPELTGTIFLIYSTVLPPLVGWCPRQLPGWLTPLLRPQLKDKLTYYSIFFNKISH